eukprot:1894557-Pleurochrysis_carterae.AAC.1
MRSKIGSGVISQKAEDEVDVEDDDDDDDDDDGATDDDGDDDDSPSSTPTIEVAETMPSLHATHHI